MACTGMMPDILSIEYHSGKYTPAPGIGWIDTVGCAWSDAIQDLDLRAARTCGCHEHGASADRWVA